MDHLIELSVLLSCSLLCVCSTLAVCHWCISQVPPMITSGQSFLNFQPLRIFHFDHNPIITSRLASQPSLPLASDSSTSSSCMTLNAEQLLKNALTVLTSRSSLYVCIQYSLYCSIQWTLDIHPHAR